MFITLVVVALVAWIGMNYGTWMNSDRDDVVWPKLRGYLSRSAWILVLAILIRVGFSAFCIIPAGSRGVVFDKISGVRQVCLTEGINFVVPIL